MGAYSFQVWWCICLVALLIIAWWIGRSSGHGALGILVDGRGRYSLTHFQTVLWTIIILSSALGVLISKGFHVSEPFIPPELLGLMGISAGSAVLATGVKASKDGPGAPNVAKVTTGLLLSNGTTRQIQPRFAQIWMEEEGDLADEVVSLTKYQNFLFTLVILTFYVAMAWQSGNLPKLPESLIWLIGISHAGYVGAKVPDKK